MILRLSPLPSTLRGPQGDGYGGRVPRRALFLAPDAAVSLAQVESKTGGLVYTDIFRSAAESLAARQVKPGVQPPGYSAHGFGIAFDIDVGASLRRVGGSYPQLRETLEALGWYCHRRDLESSAAEGWHFNYLGAGGEALIKLADPLDHSTWAAPAEKVIEDRYQGQFSLTSVDVQYALQAQGLYSGPLDGQLGPASADAIERFQKSWGLDADGVAGPKTQRTLAYVTAKVSMEAA